MPTDPGMRAQLSHYTSALKTFAASSSTFRILHSLPSTPTPSPQTLYVLDSSFNPPTLAHLHIATSALLQDAQVQPDSAPASSPKRLLLLFATQNADKAPKPASFEQRLLMMQIFASDLLSSLAASPTSTSADSSSSKADISVDIGVTKLPYFIDKAQAIEESRQYEAELPQVHLTGFDTLVRILDPKYYPPSHTLAVLGPFLARHRLLVTYRTDDRWGAKVAQDEYLALLGRGGREGEGGKREWVGEGRIAMVEGWREGEVVSSTRVREAVKEGDRDLLRRLVTNRVAAWILEEGLYKGN